MVRKCKCKKCIHCVCTDLDSYVIKCEKFGTTNEKDNCRYYVTEQEKNILNILENLKKEISSND